MAEPSSRTPDPGADGRLRIAVVGTGYLGATHAACMAELGHDVAGLDVDAAKVAALAAGRVPFYEPDLQPLLEKHVSDGRLRFTTDPAAAVAEADVVFLCVNTPQRPDGFAADLTHLEAAVRAIAPHLRGRVLVVGKSTVPVGTAAALTEQLQALTSPDASVSVAWNPEFLREGYAVQDTLRPDRLVLGLPADAPADVEATLRTVYATALAEGTPLVVTDLQTAELVKVSANAFLATKISFINAVAEICEIVDADVVALADAIGYDARIGRRFLNAGVGFGGGCLPKDIRAFMARAGELGAADALSFLREIDAINMRRRLRTVELAREMVGGSFLGCRVAVLGVAFKPDSDDVRDSPALNVAGLIQLQGASVVAYDPKAMPNARAVFPTLTYAETADEAVAAADLVLHLTEWDEFRALDPAVVGARVRERRLLDGRHTLDPAAWRAAGWTYRGLGRP
jgi:UDPglucose 6-dehydrogenase